MKKELHFKPGHHHAAAMSTESADDFKGTALKLIKRLGQYKFSLFVVAIFAVLSTVFNIVGPKILGNATTLIFDGIMNKIAGNGTGIDFSAIAKILISLLILYVFSAFFAYIQNFLMTNVAMKTTYTLRKEISHKLNKLPLAYFDRVSTGDILSRVTNDVDTLNQSLTQSITHILTSISTVVGILGMMLTINFELTIITLLIIPASLTMIRVIIKKSQKYFYEQQKYLGQLNGHTEEMYSGHVVIKAFNKEKHAIEVFDKHNEKLYNVAWKSQFLSGLIMPVMFFISNLGYVAICILGGQLVVRQTLAVGDIQAFLQYVRQFTHPLNQIANISNVLQQTAAAAERVFNFLEEPEELPDKNDALMITFENNVKKSRNTVFIDGSVEFRHVKFGYTTNKIIIKDFSAKIKPGQKVAIVGPTGAGKTTIIKLLMRFYDVLAGEILISGHNIKDYPRNELRSAFGMVLQDTWLYNASIKDNIRYGNLAATDEEIRKAAQAAHAEHFINTLPGGYEMIINEDADNVSMGQKQLLTIARAIISDPKILIFDEATSSVDTRTEILIQNAMENLMRERTSFIIAHRLSTIKNADLILVMNNGDIVEQGTHADLLSKNGFYSNLYNSQFK